MELNSADFIQMDNGIKKYEEKFGNRLYHYTSLNAFLLHMWKRYIWFWSIVWRNIVNTRGGIVLKFPDLSQAEILAISKALADTEYGFTGSELEVLLKQYDFADENPTMTKYKRLYNSFVERYNREKSCNSIYMFIQKCMDPARGLVDEEKYAKRRMETNKILMLKGIEIDDGGNFRTVQKAQGGIRSYKKNKRT